MCNAGREYMMYVMAESVLVPPRVNLARCMFTQVVPARDNEVDVIMYTRYKQEPYIH